MKRKIINITVLLLFCLAAGVGLAFYGYKAITSDPWVEEDTWIYVRKGDSQATIEEQLKATGGNTNSLWYTIASRAFGLDKASQKDLAGAYHIQQGMTLLDVMRKIGRHHQDPVKLTFIGVRSLEDLAGRISTVIEADSIQILQAMHDPEFLKECGCDEANLPSIFLPDTYEVYWNIPAQKLMGKLLAEYKRFWNSDRLALANTLELNPQQVCTLCSIAEEETANRQERGVVARLYWNRYRMGMALQADPTVKFAVGDFSLRRIVGKHLKTESPYNTYLHAGLPPGPIRIVEKATIDSFLHSEPHKYIYMCAKEDFSGLHNFATNINDHQRNAAKYHRALTQRGIK